MNSLYVLQGYTDCGFHGGDQIPTPHIDYLAHNGIILDNYYTPKICTPSRAALLTARHPMQLGLQRSVIFASHPWGLGLNETIFPQYLKKFGYITHAIGKVCHFDFYCRLNCCHVTNNILLIIIRALTLTMHRYSLILTVYVGR